MKLVVLGASGGCGGQLLREALERGHAVTAVVRSASWQAPAGVTVVRGELTEVALLRGAFAGNDAVMSALGLRLASIAPWARPEVPDFLSRSTPAVITAMRESGVRRVMAISAGGVGDSAAVVPAFFRAFIKATALRHAYTELERMESLLLSSGLDVCICRPTGLTDGPRTGRGRSAARLVGRAAISRADVAAWMLDELERPAFTARTPIITETGAG